MAVGGKHRTGYLIVGVMVGVTAVVAVARVRRRGRTTMPQKTIIDTSGLPMRVRPPSLISAIPREVYSGPFWLVGNSGTYQCNGLATFDLNPSLDSHVGSSR